MAFNDESIAIGLQTPYKSSNQTNTSDSTAIGVQSSVSTSSFIGSRTYSTSRGRLDSVQKLHHASPHKMTVVEDVDFEMSIPSKLVDMEFRADVDKEKDVAEIIRKSFSKFGQGYGAQDALKMLSRNSQDHITQLSDLEAAIDKSQPEDQFWRKVAQKTQSMVIGKLEAIFEVYTDLIVERAGTVNQALLWVLRQDYKEFCMELFVIRLLERKANIATVGNNDRNTPLHLAAIKGYSNIGRNLINEGASVETLNKRSQIPLELAINENHNDFSILLIKRMEPKRVRELFAARNSNTSSKLSLHKLLDTPSMKGTVLAVLDTMMEPLPSQDTYFAHYSVLDGDQNGRAPKDKRFNRSHKSCLHKIAKSNNKDVVNHDVVRLLLRRKWKKFARYVFFLQFTYFLTVMIFLTCALVLAAKKPDPRLYDTPVDIFRGVCEGLCILAIGYNGIAELNQLRVHKHLYFKDYFNYLDAPAVLFFFILVPFRATGLNFQWVFASLCYLFNGLRAFKYAAVFRSTGAYVQILFRILVRDMIQFGTIFLVFLLTFSGSFYLALRGEERPENDCENANMECYNNTFVTSLNLYPFETEELYHVWLTGIRVMIEGGAIVDEYYGPGGFMWLGVIIYLIFLGLVTVVLLNLLIAQMSDTYSSVQQDAQRSLAINRAWTVARVEHNSFLAWGHRERFYIPGEVIQDPKDVLEKWEVPPINEVNRKLEKLEHAVRKQEDLLEELRKNIMEKFLEQNQLLQGLKVPQIDPEAVNNT